eukprot:1159936-Pelagomonas_calceolata.AAC.9
MAWVACPAGSHSVFNQRKEVSYPPYGPFGNICIFPSQCKKLPPASICGDPASMQLLKGIRTGLFFGGCSAADWDLAAFSADYHVHMCLCLTTMPPAGDLALARSARRAVIPALHGV